MKLVPNSTLFVLSMNVEIEDTCYNCKILSKLKYRENYIIWSKLSISIQSMTKPVRKLKFRFCGSF